MPYGRSVRGRAAVTATVPGGCWPTADQVLLLRAALLGPDEAGDAWACWRRANSLDEADRASSRLFPLVYRNLPAEALDEQDLSRLKGAYRAAWFRNQLMFGRAAEALRAVHDAGISTLLLKGIALSPAHYEDGGARPMEDIDVLVPPGDADRALSALTEAGWRRQPEKRDAVGLRTIHAQHLLGPGGLNLDLHRYALEQLAPDDRFWSASVELELMGVPTRTLCPTDHLLHVLAHGGRWQPVAPVRWLADAFVIERSARDELDWDRFVDEAVRRRVTARVSAALQHLVDAVGFPVAEDVLAALGRAPKSVLERWAQQASTRPVGGGNWLPLVLDDYVRRSRLDPSLRFGAFARDYFGTTSRLQLTTRAVRKAVAVATAQTMLRVSPRLVPRCVECGCVVVTLRPSGEGLCRGCAARPERAGQSRSSRKVAPGSGLNR